MLLFILGGLEEERGYLLIALLPSLGCEAGVLVPGLRLSGKGLSKVLFRLCACVFVGVSNIDTPLSRPEIKHICYTIIRKCS